MRSEGLLFVHTLAAATLLGALLAVTLLATSGPAAARAAARASVLAAAAALGTAVLGEAARAREDVAGSWLDAGMVLGYAGLVLPALALVPLAWGAIDSTRLRPWLAGLASAMVVVALAATFVMAAKPAI